MTYKTLQVHTYTDECHILQKINRAKSWLKNNIPFILMVQSHGFYYSYREKQQAVGERLTKDLCLNGSFILRNNNLYFIPDELKGKVTLDE